MSSHIYLYGFDYQAFRLLIQGEDLEGISELKQELEDPEMFDIEDPDLVDEVIDHAVTTVFDLYSTISNMPCGCSSRRSLNPGGGVLKAVTSSSLSCTGPPKSGRWSGRQLGSWFCNETDRSTATDLADSTIDPASIRSRFRSFYAH